MSLRLLTALPLSLLSVVALSGCLFEHPEGDDAPPQLDCGIKTPQVDASPYPPVDAPSACATDLTAEIVTPIDGATGVATNVEVKYRFSPWDAPVSKFNYMKDAVGRFPDIAASRDEGVYKITTYRLLPDMTYTFDLGWYCNFGAADQQHLTLAKTTFHTGPLTTTEQPPTTPADPTTTPEEPTTSH